MIFLSISFILVISLSILITFLSITIKKSAIQVVDDMGFGWNLGGSFDCYNTSIKINNPNEQIMLWKNPIPTKKLITSIKKYGFKTIRLPVTWLHFMDKDGKVDNIWMNRVKEAVDWIVNSKMYCILNIYNDGLPGNWLSEGIKSKDKYITLWTQISREFKDYGEYLIFESMDQVRYKINGNDDYVTLFNLNQAFVDTVRNSGGKNSDRLLIIAGMNKDPELTCTSEFKIPIDPSNKLAVSIYYYIPSEFSLEKEDDPWTYTDSYGNTKIVPIKNSWGAENDYKILFTDFQIYNDFFVNKGIPVIITELGVITEENREIDSIREYLFAEFSISASYKGIMSCLWDYSNKNNQIINYFDRINEKFYDEKIGENFKKISRGEYAKLIDYSYFSNVDTVSNIDYRGNLHIRIGKRKVKKIIFNVKLTNYTYTVGFGIASNHRNNSWFIEPIYGSNGKRKYDKTYTYTIDANKNDYTDYIELQKWWGNEYITFNYLSVEFEKKYNFFDYNLYKDSLK